MVAVSYHDTVNVLQAPGAPESAALGPFDRAQWFTLLAGAGGKTPLVILARDGAEWTALALMREGRSLVALTNWYSFSWRPLASPGADLARLAEAIAQDVKGRTSRVVLAPLPNEDGTATRLEKAFHAAGWATFLERSDSNHVLPVGGRSYAEYLAGRPGQLRTTLKRKAKHVEIEVRTHFEPAAWDSYEAVYRRSWKPEEGAPAMLRAFAAEEGAAGRLRLGLAHHDGRPVAAQLWTVENGTAYIHKLAHLEEAKPLSAGSVLTAALMEHTIDRDRVGLIDFGTGDDAYKRDWMESVRPRWRLVALRTSDPRNWAELAKRRLRQLASPRPAG